LIARFAFERNDGIALVFGTAMSSGVTSAGELEVSVLSQ
jgi:hypothetical protein